MDGWISKRIRIVSRRRVIAWSLALIVGVLAATSDHRYLANFVGGPYALTQADLDSIRDVTAAPRYYARVNGNRVRDTGLRQYTVHTQNGVETSREESSAYNALAIGNHFLVVRTAADNASPSAEGSSCRGPKTSRINCSTRRRCARSARASIPSIWTAIRSGVPTTSGATSAFCSSRCSCGR